MKSKSMVFTSQGYIGGLIRSPSKEEDPESIKKPIRWASSCRDRLGSPTLHHLSEQECGETRAPTQFSPRDTFGRGDCDSRRGHTGQFFSGLSCSPCKPCELFDFSKCWSPLLWSGKKYTCSFYSWHCCEDKGDGIYESSLYTESIRIITKKWFKGVLNFYI